MKLIAAMRAYRLYGIYFLLITVPLRGDCLTLRAVFDVLFPSTPFKRLLIHATQLHGMFDTLHKRSDAQEKQWVEDVIQCRLAQIEQLVDTMGSERIKCRMQDLEYLLVVLDKVLVRARGVLHAEQSHEHTACVQRVMSLQDKIDRLL